MTEKRTPVTPTIYSPDGAFGNILINCMWSGSSNINTDVPISGNWILSNNGTKGFAFSPINNDIPLATGPGLGFAPPIASGEGVAKFHYVADARLGIV